LLAHLCDTRHERNDHCAALKFKLAVSFKSIKHDGEERDLLAALGSKLSLQFELARTEVGGTE
jgi:hypothetical protein